MIMPFSFHFPLCQFYDKPRLTPDLYPPPTGSKAAAACAWAVPGGLCLTREPKMVSIPPTCPSTNHHHHLPSPPPTTIADALEVLHPFATRQEQGQGDAKV